jgi:hypothetical protein
MLTKKYISELDTKQKIYSIRFNKIFKRSKTQQWIRKRTDNKKISNYKSDHRLQLFFYYNHFSIFFR